MEYCFKLEKEIKKCRDCPFLSYDPYGAEGCELLNEYLNNNIDTTVANNCPLEKSI